MATIADLTGETIDTSYGTLLMVTNTTGITSALQTVQSGLGTDPDNLSALKLSTTAVSVNGSLAVGTETAADTLTVAGTVGVDDYINHNGDSDTYIQFTNNNLYLRAGGKGLNLDGTGKVGFGLDVPSYSLQVVQTGQFALGVNDASYNALALSMVYDGYGLDSNSWSWTIPTTGVVQQFKANGDVIFNASGGTRVGIGGIPSTYPLEVIGSNGVGAVVRDTTDATDTYSQLELHSSTTKWRILGYGPSYTDYESKFSIWGGATGSQDHRLTIDASGNVGIGGTPDANLHVFGPNPKLRLQDDDETNVYTDVFNQSGDTFFRSRDGSSNGIFTFNGNNGTTDEEYMRIDSSGNVDVATGGVRVAGTPDESSAGTWIGMGVISDVPTIFSLNYSPLTFKTGGAERMRIDSSGNVTMTADDPVLKVEATGSDKHSVLNLHPEGTGKSQIQRAGTNVITINSSNYVGIGTTGPAAKLDVYSSATKHVRVHETGSIGDLQVLTDNDTVPALGIKGTGTADLVNVWDGSAEVFTILDGGFVGIGDDAPGRPLVVSSSQNIIASLESTDADVYLTLSDDTSTLTSSQRIGVTGDDMHFWTDSTKQLTISSAGNIGTANAFHVTNGGSATAGNAFYSPASNEVGISSNGVEAIRVDGSQNVIVANMPTSDPAIAGALWSDSGTVKISAG